MDVNSEDLNYDYGTRKPLIISVQHPVKTYTEQELIDFTRFCRERDERRTFLDQELEQTIDLLELWKKFK